MIGIPLYLLNMVWELWNTKDFTGMVEAYLVALPLWFTLLKKIVLL